MNDQEESHSGLLLVMLLLGIVGLVGLFMVAAGVGMAGGL